MATISVAIAVRDEIEENRKKQGDIIAIKEGGWQWGSGEVKNHLILEIALPSRITIDTAEALVSKYFSGGVLSVDGSAEVLAKRRFNVDWAIVYNYTDAGKDALCYVDLGGPVDMTAGDLTVTWNGSGLFTIAKA